MLGIGLRFARDGGSDIRQIRIGILGARNQAVRLLGFGHLLEREHVLLLFIDGGGEQFAGLAGGIVQSVVELALDGGRALARAEPGVEAGVGKGDRNDGRNNVNADQEGAAADVTRVAAELKPMSQATSTSAVCSPMDASTENQTDRYRRMPSNVVYQETIESRQLATKSAWTIGRLTASKSRLEDCDYVPWRKVGSLIKIPSRMEANKRI